jgi:hypothetical protein
VSQEGFARKVTGAGSQVPAYVPSAVGSMPGTRDQMNGIIRRTASQEVTETFVCRDTELLLLFFA